MSQTKTQLVDGFNINTSAPADSLVIDSSGNVGIGTTDFAPASSYYDDLVVKNATAGTGCGLTLVSNATNGFSAVDFADTDAAGRGRLTYSHSDDSLRVDVAGNEALRLDSSRRLLVGTSSTSAQCSALIKDNSGSSGPGILRIHSSIDTPVDGATLGLVAFGANNDSPTSWIFGARDGGTWTAGSSQPTRLVFSTTADAASSPTERMRIDSAGLISVNTADGSADGYLLNLERNTQVLKVDCTGTGDVVGAYFRHARGGLAGFTGKMISFVGNDGTEEGSIVIGTTTTAYNTSSDYRRKENQQLIADGIQRVKNLKPYRFNFIKHPEAIVDGFFAHEVQEVVPEAITGEKDAVDDDGNPVYQGIDQSKLVPLLTAALQEAIGEIESLKARVAALESA